jgi:hypothetical protein
LQGNSMSIQAKSHKVFENFFFLSDFVELFPLIILGKKNFWISLRNDDVLVKIFIVQTCYLPVSEKLNKGFSRAKFPLQNLLCHISPEYSHFEICESIFLYIFNYLTVFCILNIISSFHDEIQNVFLYQNAPWKERY